MATTFVKNGGNVLIYEGDKDPFSVPGSAYVGPHPSESGAIVISEKFDSQNRENGVKIYVADVETPAASDRKDLIEKLSTDFFFKLNTLGASYIFKKYRVPQELIDGETAAFVVPDLIDPAKPFWAVNGTFVNTIDDGIDSAVSAAGQTTVTFSEPIPEGNVVTIVYPSLLFSSAVKSLVFTGFLSQTGTAAPTAAVLENTLLGVWARTGAGTFTYTKAGAFTENKTIPGKLEEYNDAAGNRLTIERTSADVITLKTYAAANTEVLADGVLDEQFIHIEVYN